MKTKSAYILAFAAISMAFAACTDLTEIESQVDDLKTRVTALETQMSNLNGNVETLQTLAGGGTIKEVTSSDGTDGTTWTITTSNGTVLTLKQGSIGVGNAPVMSIDKDGYWQVDYGDGVQYVKKGDEKVIAVGQDGITPKFSIDSEDYWTVSYDGGATYSRVTNVSGQPVKAIGDVTANDSYFKNVEVKDGKFILTLKNDEVYSIPVVKDFYFIFADTSDASFDYGATKSYDIDMKGVAKTLVSAPEGWVAVLSENRLKVTAPSSATKASIADSRSDVTVLAISASGYSCIAKISVSLTGVVLSTAPTATIKALDPASNAVYFKVYADDATEWYWLILKASEPVPGVSQMKTDGKKETGISASCSLSGADEQTLYACYVLPLNGAESGTIAKATVKTTAAADQFGMYSSGKNIVIGGKSYNKADYGDPIHVTSDIVLDTDDSKGVYFVDPGVKISTVASKNIIHGDIVITSTDPTSRGTLVVSADVFRPREDGYSLIFNNINIDISNKNALTYAATTVEKVGIYGCKVSIASNNFCLSNNTKFNNIEIIDTDIRISGSNAGLMLGTVDHKTQNIIISNSIIYCPAGKQMFRIFRETISKIVGTVGTCTIEDNIFYDIYWNQVSYHGLVNPVSLDAFYFRNNVFGFSTTSPDYQRVLYLAKDDDTNVSGYPAMGEVKNNLGWNDTNRHSVCYKANLRLGWFADSYQDFTFTDVNPFEKEDLAKGEFKLKAEFESYGTKR